jgi:hypothetical protein
LHHERGGAGAIAGGKQVDMIRHEDESMDVAVVLCSRVCEETQKRLAVGILEETTRAVVPPHNQMLRKSGHVDSRRAGHGDSTPFEPVRGQALF